jgi:hypothetical protein
MRHIGFALVILPFAGIALGAGGATLLWSGMVSRAQANNGAIFKIAKDWERLANENHDGWVKCLDLARR